MATAKDNHKADALGKCFYGAAAAIASVSALRLLYDLTSPVGGSPNWPAAVAALAAYFAAAAYYAATERAWPSTILLLSACYGEILIGEHGGDILLVLPLLCLVPLAATAILGSGVGASALFVSLLGMAFLNPVWSGPPSIDERMHHDAFVAAVLASAAISLAAALYLVTALRPQPPRRSKLTETRGMVACVTGRSKGERLRMDEDEAPSVDPSNNGGNSRRKDGGSLENADFLETVLEAISDGVIAANNQGEMIYINRAARRFYGFAPELDIATVQAEIVDAPKFFAADGAKLAAPELPLFRVLRGKSPPPAELTLVMPDKTVRTVAATAKVLRNNLGEQVGGVVTFRDLTSESVQDEELRWQRNLLELILDTVPVRIWIKDAANRIVKMNNEAAAFFGVSREEAIGMDISALMPEEPQGILIENSTTSPKSAPNDGAIAEIQANDGTKNWCRIDGASFCDPRTGAELSLIAATNVTSLKIAKDTLSRANVELDQFTRAVSHDLQEPIRKMIIFSEFLEKDLEANDHESAKGDLEALKSSALRMRRMIKDLLRLSRVHETEMRLAAVDPAACIEEAIANLPPTANGALPKFRIEPMPQVCADQTLLTQIYQRSHIECAEIRVSRRAAGPWIHGARVRRRDYSRGER